jgi:hypothetical protein
VGWAVSSGLLVTALAAAITVLVPGRGPVLALGLVGGMLPLGALALLLVRRPELAPWGAVAVFAISAELKLRVSSTTGVLKDGYVFLLVSLLVLLVLRRPSTLRRLLPLAMPLATLGVLVAMYLVNPAGSHGSSWLFGTRLLVEVLVLLLVGILLEPRRSLAHLVGALAVVLPFEALFAWVQQAVGMEALVYQWGYEFGAQVRTTSGGGLRVSGTFEDPFQLAAFAVLGLALALFTAPRRQAWLIGVSAVAVLAATDVRTSYIQVALLFLVWGVRRGWGRQAALLGLVGVIVGVLVLATATSRVTPNAPEEPLLFTLNGRLTSWSLAVDGAESSVTGNGVGARGIGSTRTSVVASAPAYDGTAPPAYFAGDPAFLDSSYAQVQSDVGLVGSAALLLFLAGLAGYLARTCRATRDDASWAAMAVLVVTLVDWVSRSSLASFTTGFLTLYILGVLVGATTEREDSR